MTRDGVSQVLAFAGLSLVGVGAALLAVDSPSRSVALGSLAAGALALGAYATLNRSAIRGFVTGRSARYGANMVAMIVLFTTALIIVQAISMRHNLRYDLTRNQRYSLSAQTVQILDGLEDEVRAYGFFTQGSTEAALADDLLNQYAFHTSRFRYELIDPDRDPQRASEFDVRSYGVVILAVDSLRERVSEVSEEAITNGILRLLRNEEKTVCFVRGHGEKDPADDSPDGYSILARALTSQRYAARSISLFEERVIPEACDVLVCAGLTSDYFESEIEKIEEYMMAGGNAIFLIDPQPPLPVLEALLESYRVLLEQDVIIDPYGRILGGDFTVPVVTQYVDHPVTRPMTELSFFPRARSVNISAEERQGVRCQYLAIAGKSAWGEVDLETMRQGQAKRDEEDISPPVAVAMIASRTVYIGDEADGEYRESKMIVVGDSDFADNASFRVSGNGDLFLNAVSYLAEDEDLLTIRSKDTLGDRLFLTASQGRLILFVCIVLVPLAVMGVGTSVFLRRRRET